MKRGNDKTDAGCFCRKVTFKKSQDYNVFKFQLLDNLLRTGKRQSNHVQQLLVFQKAHILMIIAGGQLALRLYESQLRASGVIEAQETFTMSLCSLNPICLPVLYFKTAVDLRFEVVMGCC